MGNVLVARLKMMFACVAEEEGAVVLNGMIGWAVIFNCGCKRRIDELLRVWTCTVGSPFRIRVCTARRICKRCV